MTQEISLITAFTAGLLSFLAPCILPLIPPYLAWLSGISLSPHTKFGVWIKDEKQVKVKFFFNSFLLVLGFSIVFVALGASASFIGQILAPQRLLVQRIGGLIIILFGLEFIGFLKLFKNYQISFIKELFSKLNHRTSSFLVGLTFAFAWVACFSPILGSILVLSSFEETLTRGIILLSFYSLGLAIPFLLTSLFLGFTMEKINFFNKLTKWINLSSGLILIFLGILLVSDNYYKIVIWLTKILE